MATKKVGQQICFHSPHLLLFLDPGSEIRYPRWTKIRIRNTGKFLSKVPPAIFSISPFPPQSHIKKLQSSVSQLQNGVFRSMKERQEQETQRLRRELDAAQAAARSSLTQAEQLRTQLSDLQVRL